MFVTGIGSGMGLQSAKRLAAAGAHIVGFDRSGAEATRAAIEAERASPGQRVRLFVMDVSDRVATRAAIRAAVEACGEPDPLVHMAGVGGVAEMIDMPFEMFDRIMQINLYGTRHVVEVVLPHMLGRNRGTRPKVALAGSMGGFVPAYGIHLRHIEVRCRRLREVPALRVRAARHRRCLLLPRGRWRRRVSPPSANTPIRRPWR